MANGRQTVSKEFQRMSVNERRREAKKGAKQYVQGSIFITPGQIGTVVEERGGSDKNIQENKKKWGRVCCENEIVAARKNGQEEILRHGPDSFSLSSLS